MDVEGRRRSQISKPPRRLGCRRGSHRAHCDPIGLAAARRRSASRAGPRGRRRPRRRRGGSRVAAYVESGSRLTRSSRAYTLGRKAQLRYGAMPRRYKVARRNHESGLWHPRRRIRHAAAESAISRVNQRGRAWIGITLYMHGGSVGTQVTATSTWLVHCAWCTTRRARPSARPALSPASARHHARLERSRSWRRLCTSTAHDSSDGALNV